MTCLRCGTENPAGMRFCGGCGNPLSTVSAPSPAATRAGAAHRRHMTVMFCDIVGSTPLAEALDPEDFREILASYQQACVRSVDRFGGYIARYAGDGVVVYFGYPQAHEDSAQRAVHAALAIHDELAVLNRDLDAQYGVNLRVRIGLHSGVVVAGHLGEGASADQHAIVGETPHIAARLESIAEPDTIVISEATRELVEGYFETEALGPTPLKGVSRPIHVHRVIRSTGAVDRLEVAAARRLTPLVDRDRELAQIAEEWQRASAGRGATIHLTGEAGIGKSRLVHEIVARLGQQAGSQLVWQGSPHHRSTTLYPVIRCLERLLDLRRPDLSPADQLETLTTAVTAAGLDPDEAVPLLADLLSLGVEGTAAPVPAPPLAPRGARAATLQILEGLLILAPARHPLLFIVEDLHWADPSTIELLGRIIANQHRLPLLCVFTFRPEFAPPWVGAEPVLEIELEPLTSDEVRALATWASPRTLDPRVLDWLQSTSDGIPLFVEESLKMLERTGEDRLNGDGAGVPSTLQGLLTERLDRLPDLGDLIDVAAVLGREFDLGVLEAVWPGDPQELEPALVALAAHDVLRPVEGPVPRCEFAHALLQEAAYSRILRRQRQALHGRVAESFARSSSAAIEREPEIIAHHWSCAAQPDKAVHYWHAAGVRALERAAFREASHHFRRGLEALDEIGPDPGDDVRRIDFLTHLAASLQAAHGYAARGVGTAYARARTGARAIGDTERLARVIRGEWMFHLLRSEYETALQLGDEMLGLAGRGDGAVPEAEGHLYRGMVHTYLGDFEIARGHLEQAFAHHRRPDELDQIYEAQGDTGVGALAYLPLVLWNLGHPIASAERSDLGLELAERPGAAVARAQAWTMRSILHLGRGEPAEFERWLEKSRRHCATYNIGYWRTVNELHGAWHQGRTGKLAAGAAAFEENLDAYLTSGSRLSLPHFYTLLADLRLAEGDRDGALAALARGEEHIVATGERFSESELQRIRGRVLMAGDAPDAAAATGAYEAAIAAARRQNARLLELRAVVHLAVHQRAIGEPVSDLRRVAELCEWFDDVPDLPDVVRARRLLSADSEPGP